MKKKFLKIIQKLFSFFLFFLFLMAEVFTGGKNLESYGFEWFFAFGYMTV